MVPSVIRMVLVGLALMVCASLATAQVSPNSGRAQATRAELTAALGELDKITQSTGYSGTLRASKRMEAEMVRQRLAEGDFQVGDQIEIAVVGEQALSARFAVQAGRTLALPNIPPISLQGILRSEVREYLAAQISRYLRNPQIAIQGSYIRIAILGSVAKPGFYSVPADNLLSDAIMVAGGPAAGANLRRSIVRRSGRLVVSETQLQGALEGGMSLDQLNLHGGDELMVGGSGPQTGGGVGRWLLPIQAGLAMAYLLKQIL